MNQEIANAAIQFLLRAQLQGQEVPAFNAVMNALHEISQSGKASGAIEALAREKTTS